jgi:hypothetical protein
VSLEGRDCALPLVAFADPVRLSPWIKPYYRDTLHRVRRAKDLPLLACLLSVVFHRFMEYKSCHDHVIDSLAIYERLASTGKSMRTRHFAMPCSTKKGNDDFDTNVEPVVKWVLRVDKSLPPDLEPLRRKPRFDDNIFVEEVVVDNIHENYIYAVSRVRKRPVRPVSRDPYTMYTRDLISLAVARYRALELVSGDGVINDIDDVDRWNGVQKIHPKESRSPPVVWTSDGMIITLSASADGYASYGRIHSHGTAGVTATEISRAKAFAVPEYPDIDYHNIGFNPSLAIRKSNPTRSPHSYEMGGGGVYDQELQAAPARANPRIVQLWLIDTGCAHDLVSLEDVLHTRDRLYALNKHLTFETANGGTVSTHAAPMYISELKENIIPFVLKDTPAVLSIGERTMTKGY